jgi:DNA-binding GntR family transcriptional regulator
VIEGILMLAPMNASGIGDNTYQRIHTDIVFGRLRPGERLKLDSMRARYGASISTLRELLSRLSAEGLIIAESSKGFEVAPVSARNLREIAHMRLLLETHAMRLSLEAGDLEWEGRIVAAHHKLANMENRIIAGTSAETETWKRYDREFHHALISACGSRALLDVHGSIFTRYLRYQMVAVVFRGKPAADEHRTLLQAALARDFERAAATLATHVNDCVEHTLSHSGMA